MYGASVPVLHRYLQNLRAMLSLASTYPDADKLLDARLAPTMCDLAKQVEIAANFAFRCCAPLTNHPQRDSGDFARSFAGMRERIDAALVWLDTLTPEHFAGAADRSITDRGGEADITLPGTRFLSEYALPNFFFHLTTAYAILRQAGIPIGRSDFDRFHHYPV